MTSPIRLRPAWLALPAAAAFLLAQTPQNNFFTTADADRDGAISREEFRAATLGWLPPGGADGTAEAGLVTALDRAFPASTLGAMLSARGPQNQTPKEADVEKMLAALPSQAPAKPARPRRVLVLSKCAGFVHSCIPLAARTIQELGAKTGAWTATVTYDAADINAENLRQYDLIFLNNTTGAFLDDPNSEEVTAARKKALLDFVRSGKGLAGIHAASDSYHKAGPTAPGMGSRLAPAVVTAADKNADKLVSAAELGSWADSLFDKLDAKKAGKVAVAELRSRLLFAVLSSAGPRGMAAMGGGPGKPGRDHEIGTWPEFNRMIGGYFKYHWLDPQHIVYKIDDPASPINASFRASGFEVNDETYTFAANSWSRSNLHVLASVDYSKMSDADKQKEDFPREDHDYGLSWIRREGKGRVFYTAHGHNERVYAIKPMLEHILAGIQYALGDLKANDAPGK